MDHKEQHHERHDQERQQEKKEEKKHDREQMKRLGGIHPAWFLVTGVVLTVLVVLAWTLFL